MSSLYSAERSNCFHRAMQAQKGAGSVRQVNKFQQSLINYCTKADQSHFRTCAYFKIQLF